MVSFTCNACNETVKKNQVEKHYRTVCPSCSVLSCIDCGKDFHGDEYSSHTSCITEAEKYQGNLYRPKEKTKKGDVKQQEWIKNVVDASEAIMDPKLKTYLKKISEFTNVPRKKAKFLNFCRNSLRVYDQKVLDSIWDVFESQNENQTKSNKAMVSTEKSQNAINETDNGKKEFSAKAGDNELILSNQSDNINDIDKKASKKKRKRKEDINVNGAENSENNLETEKSDLKEMTRSKGKKSKKSKLEINGRNELCNNDISKKSKKEKKKIIETEDNLDAETNEDCEDKCEDDRIECKDKFNWQKTIKLVIKDAGDDGISIKKLRKKVLSAYQAHGVNHQASSNEESCAIFKKKLFKYPKAKIIKDQVFYNAKLS